MYEFSLNVTKGTADSDVVYGLFRSDVATVNIEVSPQEVFEFLKTKECAHDISAGVECVLVFAVATIPRAIRSTNKLEPLAVSSHTWLRSQPIALNVRYSFSKRILVIMCDQNLQTTIHELNAEIVLPHREVVSFEAPEVIVSTIDGGVKLDPTRKIVMYGAVVEQPSSVDGQSSNLLWTQVGYICSASICHVHPVNRSSVGPQSLDNISPSPNESPNLPKLQQATSWSSVIYRRRCALRSTTRALVGGIYIVDADKHM